MTSDVDYMRGALRLAKIHNGQTGENPSVGCVLVKDGHIIGEAVTALGGRPHAETQALAQAGAAAQGATAYVTLEPCSHYGQTGPCAQALIDAQISRCVIAAIDPDPRVHWRGAAMLQEAGIDVTTGLLADEAAKLMDAFFKRVKMRSC
jgi:diaminohydroxyphosphoribosylaminopyrimidine deaminase/5-amino-6-(5-phosphoribosylamino)uracil reductase